MNVGETSIYDLKFDRFVSLGADCGIGRALRKLRYKDKSYPFDWSITHADFIYDCFLKDFENFLIRDDLDVCGFGRATNKDRTLFLHHDFGHKDLVEDDDKFNFTKVKYDRRIDRFVDLMNSNLKTLFVRKGKKDSVKHFQKIANDIRLKYPDFKFHILLFSALDEPDSENVTQVKLHDRTFIFYDEGTDAFDHSHSTWSWEKPMEVLAKIGIEQEFEQPPNRDDNQWNLNS